MTAPAVSGRQALTSEEAQRLGELSATVKKGMQTFVEVGAALAEIRESRLYRERCSTFEAFLQIEFGIGRQRAHQLITAAEVVEGLSTNGGHSPLPENERQARVLADLPKAQQPRAWREAVKDAAERGGKVTAAVVKKAVDRIKGNGKKPSKVEAMRAQREAHAVAREKPSTNGKHPDPEDDLAAELERTGKDNDRLRALVETLQTGKAEKEYTKLVDRYARLEGRLQQALKTTSEATKDATYAKGLLAKVRKALGVTKDSEVLPAIQDLKR